MNVYMVHHRESEDYDDHLIFSTEEKALQYILDADLSYLMVKEIEVDKCPSKS